MQILADNFAPRKLHANIAKWFQTSAWLFRTFKKARPSLAGLNCKNKHVFLFSIYKKYVSNLETRMRKNLCLFTSVIVCVSMFCINKLQIRWIVNDLFANVSEMLRRWLYSLTDKTHHLQYFLEFKTFFLNMYYSKYVTDASSTLRRFMLQKRGEKLQKL